MKTLNEYIAESSLDTQLLFESIESINEDTTLEDVYNNIFDSLYEESTDMINEGLLGKLGGWLSKLGKKAEESDEVLSQKLDKASDAAKNAIKSAKEKAGKAWDKVKSVYINSVTAIDDAIAKSKDTIANLATQFKIKKENLEATIATIYANAIASGKDVGKKLLEWTKDAAKYPAQLTASATIITGAKLAMAAGFNSNMILDLLTSAGVK